MNSLTLIIPKDCYAPQSELAGQVEWSSKNRNETIEISLYWYTTGKGTQDIEIVDEHVFDTVATSGKKSFSFKLPDQPYSFSGKLITLSWAIEAKMTSQNTRDEFEFIMSPFDAEVLLKK